MADQPITIQLDEQGLGQASARTQSGPTWSVRTGPGGGMIYGGHGVPDPSLGFNGDFYIDLDSPSIYGPKTLGAWGSPIPLGGGGTFSNLILDETPAGSINGSNTHFTTANDFSSINVFLNGQRLTNTVDFTISSMTTNAFDMTNPPQTGDILTVTYIRL